MTHHFVNILTWEYFIEKVGKRDINIDGFLLKVLIYVVTGLRVQKKSGLNFAHENLGQINEPVYLLAKPIETDHEMIILPFYDNLEDIKLNDKLLNTLGSYKNVVIGISSPKQDFLAELILDSYPDKNIYCLGAALYTKRIRSSEHVFWTLLAMIRADWRRTMVKLFNSIYFFFRALLFRRKMVKDFVRVHQHSF